jgi:hypothetical protein
MSLPEHLPDHLHKWSWGAFALNWIWGLGNGVYIALLMFVPGVNLVMPFILGAKGNLWAWQKGNWDSEQDFLRTQKIWNRVGVGALFGIPAFFILVFALVFMVMRNSDPYQISFDLVQQNPSVIASIGTPVERTGWMISGTINYENDEGYADLDYEVTGPLGSGQVSFMGYLEDSEWIIQQHTFTPLSGGKTIDLLQPEPFT